MFLILAAGNFTETKTAGAWTPHAADVARFERPSMTDQEIINYYYGHRPGLTLQQLAGMTGRTLAQLKTILFN